MFIPEATSIVPIGSATNNVDVSGDFAFVAAGSAGLVVVNIADRSNAFIAKTENTPGNANDVKVVDDQFYARNPSSDI